MKFATVNFPPIILAQTVSPLSPFAHAAPISVRRHIPHGYRMATVQELEKSFNSNSDFNYELSEIGAAWAKGDKDETVCARIIGGKFTVANFRDGSFASYIAPVAFIRDESIAMTKGEEIGQYAGRQTYQR